MPSLICPLCMEDGGPSNAVGNFGPNFCSTSREPSVRPIFYKEHHNQWDKSLPNTVHFLSPEHHLSNHLSIMSVNPPQPVNVTTDLSAKADREAVYLPPSELALKYNKGLQRPLAVQPHPSASQAGSTKIKKIETFYVRPRWLFVRVETEGGVVGWGEGTLEGHTEAVQGSMKDIARRWVCYCS